MSDVESYTGILVPIDLGSKSLDSWLQDALGETELGPYESWLEFYDERRYELGREKSGLMEIYYDGKLGVLYEVRLRRFDPEGFMVSERQPDGVIHTTFSFYNGGASLGEMLEEVVSGENYL